MPALFRDRRDAGRRLARAVAERHFERPVVVALPRGGVPVAVEVAQALQAPLHVLPVHRICVFPRCELEVAAVAAGDPPAVEVDAYALAGSGMSMDEVRDEVARHLAQLTDRVRAPLPMLDGRTAIVVDDGVLTGTTARAALAALRRHRPARVVLAVPLAAAAALPALREAAEEVICLATPQPFGALGAHYEHFEPVRAEDVDRELARCRLAVPWHHRPAHSDAAGRAESHS
jgi:putative phosphoribosyl transferase